MLSIIIPTMNAEATLAGTLDSVLTSGGAGLEAGVELVVVDGRSRDETRHVALDHGARVIKSKRGRGRQLANGANEAKGDWLLFLHADTRLPADWANVVSGFIAKDANRERAACFRLAFDDASPGARRVARLANWRTRILGLPYGDQGLLISKSFYHNLSGYRAELDLMEDVDMVRRIGGSRLTVLGETVTTSAARYHKDGWWVRPVRNLFCLALYFLGAGPKLIKRFYA